MSRHNYTQYSNDKKNGYEISPEIEAELKTSITEAEETVEPEVTLTVEPTQETEPQPVTGTIANCTKLNIRVKPAATATVACVLNAGTKLEIDVDKSTSEWLKVSTDSGVDGYCMRQFVESNL